MKKVLVLVVAMVLVAGVAFAANTVVGSKHDMRSLTAPTSTEVCVYFHTPHGALASAAPLWNHTDTGSTFTLYTSSTLNGTTSQPSGVSRACLSCHDGTIALNDVQNIPASGDLGAGTPFIPSGAANFETNLTNDHPVSITYNNTDDAGLRAPTGSQVINGAITMQLFGAGPTYSVECGSCHGVHDNSVIPFLRVANTNSQMCTTCHIK